MIFISSAVFGQNPSGCMIYPYNFGTYSGRVHQNRLWGVSVPRGAASDIQQGQPVYDGGSPTFVNVSCYKQPSNSSLRECAVRVNDGAGGYYWFGGVFAQALYSCPIDDYIPYMLLAASILGLIFIRKQDRIVKT